MARIFISHSSKDDHPALAVRDYLVSQGWLKDEIFLDISSHSASTGLSAGERWRAALDQAQHRCEAVLFLISKNWLASKECEKEYKQALNLEKSLLFLIIDDTAPSTISTYLRDVWQFVSLKSSSTSTLKEARFDTKMERVLTAEDGDKPERDVVYFNSDGLRRFKNGLAEVSLRPENFVLAKDNSEDGIEGWRMPYQGLATMKEEDAAVFFGRDHDIERGLEFLNDLQKSNPPRCLVILGASGAGKSSFLRAGLLPRLKRDDLKWLPLLPIRTNDLGLYDGEEGLHRSIAEAYKRLNQSKSIAELKITLGTLDGLRANLRELRQIAKETALIPADQDAPQIILSLDQAEEFFRRNPHPETTTFLHNLSTLIKEGELCCIAAIRSDRFNAMQTSETFKDIQPECLSLQPIATASLNQIISAPAEMLKRHVPNAPTFSPSVVEALAQQMENKTDALPLLAFTLSRLIKDHMGRVRPGGNVITLEDLKSDKGISGTIEVEVEAALNDFKERLHGEKPEALIRRAFIPRLARINPDGLIRERRVARKTEFAADQLTQLIDAFVKRRLLTVKGPSVSLERDENGNVRDFDEDQITVEVAHEALLRDWPLLSGLLDAETSDLLLMENILLAAKDWEENDRAKDYINHRGARLEQANALIARDDIWREALKDTQDYLAECHKVETQSRKRRKMVMASIISGLFLFLGAFAFQQSQNSKQNLRQTLQALENRSQLLVEMGEAQIEQQENTLRINLMLESVNHNPNLTPSLIAMKASTILSMNQLFERRIFKGHEGSVVSAVFSPDGRHVLTASRDNTARLWDAKSGEPAAIFKGHEDSVVSAVFSPDGRHVLTASRDRTARLWDAKSGEPAAIFKGHEGSVVSAVFSPDGRHVLTASWDDTARLWDAKSGEPVAIFKGREDSVWSAVFSPDGRHVLTASRDRTARLWDAKSGEPAAIFKGHKGYVWSAVFSPDGRHVLTASGDRTARLWDAKSSEPVVIFKGHEGTVISAVFSPDGRHVLTASWDNTARLWDAKSGEPVAIFKGHEDSVWSAVFSPDGRHVLTASRDRTARLWDAKSGEPAAIFKGHEDSVWSAVFSPDGRHVLTASRDGTAILQSVSFASDWHNPKRVLAFGVKVSPRCIAPTQRKDFRLPPDPPCWCQEKPYPALSVWEDDYLSRHPELDLSNKDGIWPEGKAKPNPFTHERSDGWTCPAKGTGYSAPWKAFPDIDALTVDELLGPADEAYARLDELGIDY